MAPKSKTPAPEKTADMLDEDRYWSMIHQAKKAGEDQDEMADYLSEDVEKLSPKEMIGFKLRTDYLANKAYTSEMWCAAYVIKGGCSDDGFEYFRLWLISMGKDIYYKALANPDSLADVVNEDNDFEFEDLAYVAVDAFESKTEQDLYDFIDDENFPYHEEEMDFTWEEDNEESQKKICPKLYAKFVES